MIPDTLAQISKLCGREELIEKICPNVRANYRDPSWLKERAILAPLNDYVGDLNGLLLKKLPGQPVAYRLIDTVKENDSGEYPVQRGARMPGQRRAGQLFSPINLNHAAAIRHGKDHEPRAVQASCSKMAESGPGVEVAECDLVLHPEYSFLEASPDRMVFNSTAKPTQCGLLEVKCPHQPSSEKKTVLEVLQMLHGN